MPIYWTIDSQKQLMTAMAKGQVRQHEALAYLDAMMVAKAGGYRRLFDGSQGEPLMTSNELMEVAARMRSMQQEVTAGPLAVVMPAHKYAQFARMLGILSVPERPAGEPVAYVTVFARGLTKHQFTAVFLDDDPTLDQSTILAQVPAPRRDTLVARKEADGTYRWDIWMQTDKETVFFDYR